MQFVFRSSRQGKFRPKHDHTAVTRLSESGYILRVVYRTASLSHHHTLVLTFPSILTSLCLRMYLTSGPVSAYFSLFLRKSASGIDSLSLCGPDPGLVQYTPPSLSSIHDFGATRRFRCFLGPRVILAGGGHCETERVGEKKRKDSN